jgi:Fe-Mn family superoxide dismutase
MLPHSITRRSILTATLAAPLLRVASAFGPGSQEPAATTEGKVFLPALPYPADALTKVIDRETMVLHHDRHHAGYVRNLNEALAKLPEDVQKKPIEEILRNLDGVPEEVRTDIRNNGGGHDNHSIFWTLMSPTGGGAPDGKIGEIIERDFGGFDSFKNRFKEVGTGVFGSGWVWLVLNGAGKYEIVSRANQDSPRMDGMIPIMGNDVWEHAYYLRYNNRRGDYLDAWWNVVNWRQINERVRAAEMRG